MGKIVGSKDEVQMDCITVPSFRSLTSSGFWLCGADSLGPGLASLSDSFSSPSPASSSPSLSACWESFSCFQTSACLFFMCWFSEFSELWCKLGKKIADGDKNYPQALLQLPMEHWQFLETSNFFSRLRFFLLCKAEFSSWDSIFAAVFWLSTALWEEPFSCWPSWLIFNVAASNLFRNVDSLSSISLMRLNRAKFAINTLEQSFL